VKIGPNQYNSITNEAVAFTQAASHDAGGHADALLDQFNALVATLPRAEKVTEERDMTTKRVHPSLHGWAVESQDR